MQRERWPLLVSSSVALFAATPISAQASEETAEGAIVVLAERLEEATPETLATFGSRLEIVDGDTIDRAGFADTAQALQMLVPGLFVSPKSGAFDYVSVSLAGSRSSEVLFLVDGVRISNRLYAGTTPLDTLPSGMIERIEVLKGGQGLYYGTQAVGGVVNVITRAPSRTPDGRVEVGYDSNTGYHLNGFVRDGVGDHHFTAFLSHDQAEGFQPFRDEHTQPSAIDRRRGYEVTMMGGKYAWEPSDAFRLSASYQHTDATLDFAKAEDVVRNWNRRNEEIASIKIDWQPADDLAVYLKGYWHDWDSTYLDLRPVLGADGRPTGEILSVNIGERWGFDDKGFNVLGEYRLSGALALVAGYDFQTYGGRDDVFLIAPTREEVHAPFAQVKLESAGLSIAAGARHNVPSDGESKTVWNISGRYGLDNGFYARGQVGTAFRLPDAYELYVIDPCCETGNPDLVGESSFNTELGLGYRRDRLSAEVIGFYRRVEDLIGVTYDLPDYPDGFLINTPDAVQVRGAEVVVTAQLGEVLGATFDYTRTRARQVGTKDQLANIPRDLLKVILTVREPGGRFGGGAAFNYVGNIWSDVAAIGRVEHGNYALVDLSAWGFLDADRRHRLGLRLENALDSDYDTRVIRAREDMTDVSYAAGFRGTPRTIHASYSISF